MIGIKLKAGDIVKLKSGGPSMTVSGATEDKVECFWFVDGSVQQASFTPETVKTFQGKKRQQAIDSGIR